MAAQYFGLKFPLSKNSSGIPAASTDEDLIQESLKQILMTVPGERVMRPQFGSNILGLVFENNTEILEHYLDLEIRSAISKFEPRVVMRNITVERKEEELIITIYYVIVATSAQASVSLAVTTAT